MGDQRRLSRAAQDQSDRPDPDPRDARRQRAVRKCGHPDPSRRRASGGGPAAAGRGGACASGPRPRVHRRQLLFGHHRHRFSRALLQGHGRLRQGSHPRRDARAPAPALGNIRRHVSGATVPGRQRHRRAGSLRGGRDQVVGLARTSGPQRPPFHAALLKIEAHPKVAAVFARNWRQAKREQPRTERKFERKSGRKAMRRSPRAR